MVILERLHRDKASAKRKRSASHQVDCKPDVAEQLVALFGPELLLLAFVNCLHCLEVRLGLSIDWLLIFVFEHFWDLSGDDPVFEAKEPIERVLKAVVPAYVEKGDNELTDWVGHRKDVVN